jgi:hypothetical protein
VGVPCAVEHQRIAVETRLAGLIEVKGAMVTGLSRLNALALHLGILTSPEASFGSDKHRFSQRFGCFEPLGDDVFVPFEKVMQEIAVSPGASAGQVL